MKPSSVTTLLDRTKIPFLLVEGNGRVTRARKEGCSSRQASCSPADDCHSAQCTDFFAIQFNQGPNEIVSADLLVVERHASLLNTNGINAFPKFKRLQYLVQSL